MRRKNKGGIPAGSGKNRALALLLILALLLPAAVLPGAAADGDGTEDTAEAAAADETAAAEADESESETDSDTVYEEIYIETVEDLLALAENCRLDTWSRDKRVILQADLDLQDAEFEPIASFGGIFEGNGYTISGLYITEAAPLAGLFAGIQESGVVQDLHVCGTILQDGTAEAVGGITAENYGQITGCSFSGTIAGTENTGGIAGINAETGQITDCTAGGALSGESMTGGIAGANLGLISGCSNTAGVNIESGDEAISLADLDLSTDLTGTISDTGGITGYNSGYVLDCENSAAVGYPHVGYNVGGIAGRSCGCLLACTNTGAIQGRKDVGGIIGQIEPYISVEITADLVELLETDTAELRETLNAALDSADEANAAAAERVEAMLDDLDELSEALANFQIYGSVSSSVTGSASTSAGVSAAADAGGVDASVSTAEDSGITVDVTDPSVTVETWSDESSGLSVDTGSGLLSGLDLDIGSGSASDSGLDVTVTTPDVDVDVTAGVDVDIDAEEATASAGIGADAAGSVNAYTSLTVTTSMYQVTAALDSLTDEVRLMEDELSEQGYTLTDELRAASDRVEEMVDEFTEALENPEDIVSDTSAVDLDSIILGRTADCSNEGTVNGDINTGGIAGAMAIEYAADPEDDISSELSATQRRSYELKAVVIGCENTGTITGRRSYAGGICGLMGLGLITGCENYGSVASESGDYVGGICGLTAATVRSCFVKCSLSGGSAVGGITGSGTAEALGDESSMVAGNYAMVEITEAEEYTGAISGMNAGDFEGNYFVSDTLAGIAGLSYAGKAEPISYDALCEVSGLPAEFSTFTLTFTADDTVLKTVEFLYGESFDAEIYPDIPEKDGYYGQWARTELEDLHFDTEVSVVYTQYTSALTAGSTREDGRQIFYVQGDFETGESVTASVQVRTPAEFGTLTTGAGDALEAYFEQLENQSWTEAGLNREVVEQWYLQIPDDGQSTHEIRYLAPDGQTGNLEVYVKRNGTWEWVQSEWIGSYLVFDLKGTGAEVAILSTIPLWWAWVAAAVLLLLLVLLILHLLFRRRRRKKAAQTAHASGAPATEQEAQLLQRALEAEQRLAGKEAALAVLQNGGTAEEAAAAAAAAETAAAGSAAEANPAGDTAEEADGAEAAAEEADADAQPRKRRHVLPKVLAIAAAVILVLAILCGGKLFSALQAWRILRNYTGQEELAMEISVSATLGGADLDTEAVLCRTELDGEAVSVITLDGVSVYYSDGTLYLENGTSYGLSSLVPDYGRLLDLAEDLFRTTDLTRSTDDDVTTWALTAEGDDAADLLEILLPAAEDAVSTSQTIRVELEAEDGELTALRFRADGTLADAAQTAFSVRAEAAALEDVPDADIPAAVEDAIADADSGDADDEEGDDAGAADAGVTAAVTSDLLNLVSAWSSLYGQEVIAADMTLSADLGPLQVSQTLAYYETEAEGTTIRSVQKNRLQLYFTEDTVCDADGDSLELADAQLADSAALLDLVYALCLNGDFSCEGEADSRVYTITLDEDGMQAVILAIAPDAADLDITFSEGSAAVTVEDGALTDISIRVDGTISILLAETDIAAAAEIVFREDDGFAVPDAVLEALTE